MRACQGYHPGPNPVSLAEVAAGRPSKIMPHYLLDEVRQLLAVLPEPARTVVAVAVHRSWRSPRRRLKDIVSSPQNGVSGQREPLPHTSAGAVALPEHSGVDKRDREKLAPELLVCTHRAYRKSFRAR